jgi:hypothetical protein
MLFHVQSKKLDVRYKPLEEKNKQLDTENCFLEERYL